VTIGEAGWSYRYLKVFESGAVSVGQLRDKRDVTEAERWWLDDPPPGA
jgi:hypothetical protein